MPKISYIGPRQRMGIKEFLFGALALGLILIIGFGGALLATTQHL